MKQAMRTTIRGLDAAVWATLRLPVFRLRGERRIALASFPRSGNTWTQVGSDIDGEAASDESGNWLSLSWDGTRVAIGAPLNDGGGADSGHARLYAESANEWFQVGPDLDGEAAGDKSAGMGTDPDYFLGALSLSGDTSTPNTI